MKSTLSTFHLLLFLILIGTESCNRYIDQVKTERRISAMQGSFTFYPDSNVLIYKSNIKLGMDTEVYTPRPFYTKVPKRLLWYKMANSTSFSFFYKAKQVIAIYIDLSAVGVSKDTAYIASDFDREQFLPHFSVDLHTKYDLWNIEMIKGRKHFLIRKGAATILLYNILPRNYDSFIEEMKQFRFL